jgi:hypothetical protein
MRHTWRALLASVNELNARLGDGELLKIFFTRRSLPVPIDALFTVSAVHYYKNVRSHWRRLSDELLTSAFSTHHTT